MQVQWQDERIRRLRNELQQSKSEEKRLSEENESLRSEADALKRRLNEFRSEVEQLNHEVDSRLADQRDRLAEDLRTALLEPAGNLRDSIEGVAEQMDDPSSIRPVAVAFDQLHRKLRRRLNAKDERRIDQALRSVRKASQ